LGDVFNLVVTIANYTYEFLFPKQFFHLEGEKVFGSTKCSVEFSPKADDELHRLDCVNFSHLHVVVPAC
jgi:hypothetical protein